MICFLNMFNLYDSTYFSLHIFHYRKKHSMKNTHNLLYSWLVLEVLANRPTIKLGYCSSEEKVAF